MLVITILIHVVIRSENLTVDNPCIVFGVMQLAPNAKKSSDPCNVG